MTLLDTIERTTGDSPQFSILWLHGLGADGNDFAPIVPELVRPGWPALRFVFPHAPMRAVTVNGGMRMRAWYDLLSIDPGERREDEGGVRESIAQVEALIDAEVERGIAPERIILAGFSQGAAIALATGVRRSAPLAGVVALSGYLPLPQSSLAEATPVGLSLPVFMAHGSQDPVVPEVLGTRSRDVLVQAGMDIDWHSYPMPHSVCAEEVRDLGDWLTVRLGA